jgi:hypothetical protein
MVKNIGGNVRGFSFNWFCYTFSNLRGAKLKFMKFIHTVIFSLFFISVPAQEISTAIKLIPEISLKFGSQQPAVGGQLDAVAGILFNEKYFAGIGSGYTTNMGMGGGTIPLFFDGRYYLFLPKSFLFRAKDNENNFLVDFQTGMTINNNNPYKTGFLLGLGLAYRFDFIKIKQFDFPAFYLGFNIEYNRTKLYDEYRGYALVDGTLVQTFLNIKIAFDFKAIPVN